MNATYAVTVVLAGCHLFFVFWGAFGLPMGPVDTSAAKVGTYYKNVTGAGHAFTFFAPGVAHERRATFDLTDEAGKSWSDELRAGCNQEMNLHLHTSLVCILNAEVRHDVAASWAALMLSRHPNAKQVVVRFEMRSLPTMEAFRTGIPLEWTTFYEATFFRPDLTS